MLQLRVLNFALRGAGGAAGVHFNVLFLENATDLYYLDHIGAAKLANKALKKYVSWMKNVNIIKKNYLIEFVDMDKFQTNQPISIQFFSIWHNCNGK